jgi:hypothetical protein
MAGPREVPELEVRERPLSTLRKVDGGPLGGVEAGDLGAPTNNAKKRRQHAPERCRRWRSRTNAQRVVRTHFTLSQVGHSC